MTIDLPPRRVLPEDVKVRMRPAFAEARARNHIPLAVAAGVMLLIAGGVALTQPGTRDADPGRDRLTTPSSQDVARCRAALNDQNWSSTEMAVFGLRKVLVGEDGRFCALTRSRASVAPPGFQPSQLEAGSITFRSSTVIAGVPPLGARTVKAREAGASYSRGSSDGVVTPDFFIVHTQSAMLSNELIFDVATVPIPQTTSLPAEGETDSFDSGDGNPATPVNILARCIDNALNNSARVEDLQDWEPLQTYGLDRHNGLLLAHRGHREWATCIVAGGRPLDLSLIRTRPDGPDAAQLVGGYESGDEFIMVGRTTPAAKSVEVSGAGGPPVTADVADGHFIVALPTTGGVVISPGRLRLVARNAANEVVYEGGLS